MFGRFANPERELYRDLEQPLAEISRQSDLNLFEVFVIAKALDREIHGHSGSKGRERNRLSGARAG
jgi:hypothetical protein